MTTTATTTATLATPSGSVVRRLTDIERAIKTTEHEFGICDNCDVGLDHEDDFTVCLSVSGDSVKVRCNACKRKDDDSEFSEFCSADPFSGGYDEWN